MATNDLDPVSEIEAQAYAFPWTRQNFADSLAAGYDGWMLAPDADCAPRAYAILMWAPDEAHLLNLTVAPAWQGHGLGRMMVEMLINSVDRRGAERLLLEVRPSNPVAIGLYDRCGFVRIGVRRNYYPAADGAREDAIVMERRFE